jgi:fructoselysine-6-P-deglycase FrlB-like protein
MNTITALEEDIKLQENFIKKFTPQKPFSKNYQKRMVFCGTGDSFAAALLAEAFSNFLVRTFDPLDLLKNRSIAKNNTVFLVSISGNTSTNIKLAKLFNHSVAVTANPKSKLSMSSGKTITLNYPSSNVFTSGSIGFLASALTCISLVTKFSTKKVSSMFLEAKKISKRVKLSGKVFILGNLHTFPISMYFAAKLYEVLGIVAQYEHIEQFSHMGLFSAKKGDTVFIFDENSPYNTKLKQNLTNVGMNVIHPTTNTKDKIAQICFYTFLSQFVSLFYAKKFNQKQCYFVIAKNLRDASSKMIY